MSFADELRESHNVLRNSPGITNVHEENIIKIKKAQENFISEFEKAVKQIAVIKNNNNERSVSGYFLKFGTYLNFEYYYDFISEKWEYSNSFSEKYNRKPIAIIIDRVVITPVGAKLLTLPTPHCKDSVYFGNKEFYPPKNIRLSDEMVDDCCFKIHKLLNELGFDNITVRAETVRLNNINTETNMDYFESYEQYVRSAENGKILYVSFRW